MKSLKKIISILITVSILAAMIPLSPASAVDVATIDEQKYSSLADALEAANDYDTVTLKTNAELERDVTLRSVSIIVINQGSYIITGDYKIKIPNGTVVWSDVINNHLAAADDTCMVKYPYDGSYYKYSVVTAGAQVGDIKYETLKNAIDSAPSGATVKLLKDINYGTIYTDRNIRDSGDGHSIDLKDLTLDLNGHTISTVTGTVSFGGSGAIITNGTFNHLSNVAQDKEYALIIDNNVTSYNSNATVTVSDVVCNGGINICGASVILNNVTAHTTPTKKYTVWAETNASVIINSGSYTDTWTDGGGIFATGTGAKGGASVTVNGGSFSTVNSIVFSGESNSVRIAGGTFDKDPSAWVNNETYDISITSNCYTVIEKNHTAHNFDYSNPLWRWRIIDGNTTAIATYKCISCNETENEIIIADFTDTAGGKRIYTATDSHGNMVQKTTDVEFKVRLNDTIFGPYKWGDVCILSTEEKVKWNVVVNNESYVMADGTNTYSFAVTSDTIVNTEETDTVTPSPAVMTTIISTENNKAVFNAKWTIPGENVTIQSVKIYRGYTSGYNDVITNTILKNKGKVFNADLLVQNGDYTLNLDGLTSGTYQYAIIVVNFLIDENPYTLESAIKSVQVK